MCSNTPGSFTCSCNPGFTLSTDGRSCVDVDECGLEVGRSCQQGCVNTPGSFMCQCDPGYNLNSDGQTCSGK